MKWPNLTPHLLPQNPQLIFQSLVSSLLVLAVSVAPGKVWNKAKGLNLEVVSASACPWTGGPIPLCCISCDQLTILTPAWDDGHEHHLSKLRCRVVKSRVEGTPPHQSRDVNPSLHGHFPTIPPLDGVVMMALHTSPSCRSGQASLSPCWTSISPSRT